MTNDEGKNFDIRHSGFGIDSSFWFRHSGLLLLALILIVAAALRIHRAGQTSLSFDEIWHLALSTGNGSPHMVLPTDVLIENAPSPTSLEGSQPFWRVWGNIQRALHPPLYFTVLHIWREIFGPGDFAAQGLSIVCSLIMLILLHDFARLRFGSAIALASCGILAAAPMEIFLHQQTRGYAMLQMLGMGALSALTRIELLGFSRRRAIALLLASLGMMLTHYFAVAACAGMWLYVLTSFRDLREHWEKRSSILVLLGALLVYAICWGPFIPAQFRDIAATADTFLKENRPDHFLATLARLLQLPGQQLFNLPADWPFATACGIGVSYVFCLMALKDPKTRLPVFFLAGTFGFVALLDLMRSTTHLLYVRYTMLGLPAFVVLMLIGLRTLRITPVSPAGIIVIGCMSINFSQPPVREEPDWWQMREFVQQEIKPDDVVIFSSGHRAAWFNQVLYLGVAHYSRVFPHPMVLMTRPLETSVQKSLTGRTKWLIVPGPARPEEWVPGATIARVEEFPPIAQVFKLQ